MACGEDILNLRSNLRSQNLPWNVQITALEMSLGTSMDLGRDTGKLPIPPSRPRGGNWRVFKLARCQDSRPTSKTGLSASTASPSQRDFTTTRIWV